MLLLLACQSDMKKVEIEVGGLELRRSFSFFGGFSRGREGVSRRQKNINGGL